MPAQPSFRTRLNPATCCFSPHLCPVTKDVLQGLGDLSGKILIDAVNPVLPDLSALALGITTSAAEQWPVGRAAQK
jgi:hypothetical protein